MYLETMQRTQLDRTAIEIEYRTVVTFLLYHFCNATICLRAESAVPRYY